MTTPIVVLAKTKPGPPVPWEPREFTLAEITQDHFQQAAAVEETRISRL